jgi:hypothetical protein
MGQDVDRIRRDVSLSATIASFGYKLTKDGDEFRACCPFHSEKSASFSAFTGSDGTERFFCFGCGEKGDVLDFVMQAKGVDLPGAIRILDGKDTRQNVKPREIEVRDPYADITPVTPPRPIDDGKKVRLYNPKRAGDKTEWGGFVPSASYLYRDADGVPIGYVLRHELPDGRKETPMVRYVRLPNGQYTWSRFPFDKPRPLYGLKPDLRKQVIVVEGEKCKDALEVAAARDCASWAGGTQGVKHSDWAPLAGHDVLIWPDNDAPGFATALEIAATLAGSAERVRFIDITKWAGFADLPKGWDAADAIADGWDKPALDAFMKATVSDSLPPFPTPEPPKPTEKPQEEQEAPAAIEAPAEPAALPDDGDGLAPAKIKREVSTGVQGVKENMPAFLGSLEIGSEVEMSHVFFAHLMKAAGGEIIKSEGEFWAYGPTAWQVIPDNVLRLAAHGFSNSGVGDKGTPLKLGKRMIDGVINELGTITQRQGFFDDVTEGVNVLNGTVIVDEAGNITLRDHDPADGMRFTIEAAFGADSPMHPPEGSMLHKLVHGSFKGDEDGAQKIDLIGEILGAAALGLATRIRQPKAFTFLGVSASNGKSTIAGLLSCLLPNGAVSAISPANLGDERRIINLAGKAANVANEISAAGISGEAFKAAVTGDVVEGRDVYRPAFTFRPRAIHVYTANKLPTFSGGLDRGLQRRLVVVQFNRTIPNDEVVPDILDRIKRDELHLLLGFAIAGAQRLKRNGGYTIPSSSSEELRNWMQLDPINEWQEARTRAADIEPVGGWFKTVELYDDFKEWAKGEGHKESFLPAVTTFGQRLAAFPGVTTKRLASGKLAMGIALIAKRVDANVPF